MGRFIAGLAAPSRGEIWRLRTRVGTEEGKALYALKPWLVVSANQWAEDVRWQHVLTVRLTGNVPRRPTQIGLAAADRFGGTALCETLTALPRWAFVGQLAAVSRDTLRRVEAALAAVLGMEP